MRFVNICSALTGAAALIMMAVLRHAYAATQDTAVLTAGIAQLSAAATGLAVAERAGRINLVAIAALLAGANVFAGVIYASAINPTHPFHALAPVGGSLQIIGWVLLAFASPARREAK